LALKSDGTVWAWGHNVNGQLGNGNYTSSNVPVQVVGLTDVVKIAVGGYHCFAMKSDSTWWAWGNNLLGQLGDGSAMGSNVPIAVNPMSGIIDIAGGYYHTVALKNDGTVWAWGNNIDGQLGDNTNNSSLVPVQVYALGGVTAIATGRYHYAMALKGDGTVWTWGLNTYGQLGNGTYSASNFPVQVSGLSNVIGIDGSAYHAFAIRSDSTVWAWGDNYYGALGNGNTNGSTTPVQTLNLTGIEMVTGGVSHSIARKSDGTIYTWGTNGGGQLGLGNFGLPVNYPVEITTACAITTYSVEIEDDFNFTIFPNPSKGNFKISANGLISNGFVSIYNQLGMLVLTQNAAKEIEMKDVSAGIYFVKLQMGEKVYTRKIVIED
jgi:alpha-tubulin suppressor-like RCC1 family protein